MNEIFSCDPIFLFIQSQQNEESLSSVPLEWVLMKAGTLKKGNIALDWTHKCKALLKALVARVTPHK